MFRAVRSGPVHRPSWRERVARAHRAVAQPVVEARSNRPDAGLRDDLDEERVGAVVLGGELVARDANRLDLRLRRQPPAFEAVDAHHRAGPAMSMSCRCISSGSSDNASICSRVSTEPNASLRRSAAPACASCLTSTVSCEVLDEQHDDVPVVARPEPHLFQHARIEPLELRTRGVAAGRQAADGRLAVRRRFAPAAGSSFCVAGSVPVTVTVASGMTAFV